MSKSKEALALLDDLDSFTAPPPAPPAASTTQRVKTKTASISSNPGNPAVNDKDAADALAFLDEITQKSAEPRKSMQTLQSTTRVTLGGSRPGTPSHGSNGLRKSVESPRPSARAPESASTADNTGGGWGWGSVWTTASAAIAQAKEKVDEQVKNIPQNDQVRKWGEGAISYVKQAQLDKLAQDLKTTSLSTLTGIMNAVAPPIAEHEVIQVTLSHDMVGYDGVESLVYRGLARVLEQVQGGDLVVNRGNESRAKDAAGSGRELNPVDGLISALKLAEVDINEQIKTQSAVPKKDASASNPTTYTPVYLRIQPFTSTFPSLSDSDATPKKVMLQFLIYLSDPEHQLLHTTVSQTVPASWMELWDLDGKPEGGKKNGEWIEDMLVETLRVAVEILGQEYVVSRMSWDAALERQHTPETKDEPAAEA